MSSDAIARPVRAVVNRFGFVYLLGADGARLATIYGSRAERGARALAIAAALNGDDAGGAAAIGAAPEPAGDPAPALARLACDTVAAGRPCTYPACGCTAMSTYIMPLIAAGWRPPPEPQAPRDALERGIQRVMSMPLPEPQAAAPSADWLRRKIATDPDMDADAGGPPQAAASEVVAQAQRFINSFSHLAKPPQPTMSFAREVVAQHARAEAAERERDVINVDAQAIARRSEDWQRRHDAAEAALAETNAALAPLDAVVHALGIEDSDADPAEAVTALQAALAEARAEIERLRGAAAELCRAIKSDTFSEDRCEVSEALAQERRNRLWGAYTATRAALEAGHGR